MGKIIAIIAVILIALGAVIAAVFFISGGKSDAEGSSAAEAISSYHEPEAAPAESATSQTEATEVLITNEADNTTYDQPEEKTDDTIVPGSAEVEPARPTAESPAVTTTSSTSSTTHTAAAPSTSAQPVETSDTEQSPDEPAAPQTTSGTTKSSTTTASSKPTTTSSEPTSTSSRSSGAVTKPVPIEAELFGTIEGSIGDYFN